MLELGIGRALSGLTVLVIVFVSLPEHPLLALAIVGLWVDLPIYRLLQQGRDDHDESGEYESDRRPEHEW